MLKPLLVNFMRRTVIFALGICLGCAWMAAQSTTEGAIGGTVFDSTGAVVPNATVSVHNNGTNAEQRTASDSAGYYRINNLQPGSYTVSVSQQGFAAYKAEQVIVTVGSLTEVSPHMKVGGTAETVEVTAQAPQINYVSPEMANTLDQTAIANLPINGGRWSNFALLTPGVVSDSNAFGLLSFRGISTLLNNNTVDGADNNQAYFSEERGRTRIGYSTPKEAVDEFQVNLSNYSSEYGRSAGGVVNTVTKSGTNSIHGSGYFFDRDNNWGAFNEFTTLNVPNGAGGFSSVPFKPTDWRKMAGGSAGGWIRKDKLFWFVAYDWYHHNFPGVALPSNPGAFFATQTASLSDAAIVTFAQRLNGLASNVNPSQPQLDSALSRYNADLNALNGVTGQVPREGDQNIFFPKIDWIINSNNHASFSFNRMRWNSPAGIQTAASVTRGLASFGNDFVKDTWGVAKLDSSITPNLLNQLRFQYGRDFEFEFTQPPTPYELSTLVNTPTYTNPKGLPPSVSVSGPTGAGSITFGVPNFLNRQALPDETRQQYADTMTWSRGKHTLKFGFDYSHVDDNIINLFEEFGAYSYNNLIDYFSDVEKVGCNGLPCYSSFAQGLGLPGVDFATNDYAVFAQDDWKITRRLSLSLGLRWEYEKLPRAIPSLVNTAVPQTESMPNDKNNLGPRVGFAWDIFGSGKTVLRGGYGVYYGRIINSAVFNALTVTAVPGSQAAQFFTPTTTGAPTFPRILASPNAAASTVDFFSPNFQNPQIHEMDLTVERDLGWGTVLSVSYMGSLGRELPDFVDTNICTSASQVRSDGTNCPAPGPITYKVTNGGPLGAGPYTTTLFTSRLNLKLGSLTEIFSGINSSYHAMVVQVNHRMSHNVQFGINYTWSHAYDFGQNQQTGVASNNLLFPTTIKPERGNSIYDVPSRIVFNAVINFPWQRTGWAAWFTNGWQLSPIIQVQNGLPYNLAVSGNAPGGLSSGINGSGGSNRLDVMGVNSFRMPYTLEPDVRLAKSFSFQEKYRLQLSADFFNIINRQNWMTVATTGYSIATSNVNTPSGLATCSKAAPCLNFNVNPNANFAQVFGTKTGTNNSNFLYTPRQIQIGARISF